MPREAHDIDDLFNSAAEVLITPEARQKYEEWADAIDAPAVKPSVPKTRATAIPDVLLRGPFEGVHDLIAVAFYVGIGFIEVCTLDAVYCTYGTTVIDGDGLKERDAFLTAARDLFFHDVKFRQEIHA